MTAHYTGEQLAGIRYAPLRTTSPTTSASAPPRPGRSVADDVTTTGRHGHRAPGPAYGGYDQLVCAEHKIPAASLTRVVLLRPLHGRVPGRPGAACSLPGTTC
ncbi:hypothetical protein QJS66_01640 [Kocuria rhizophila]|nr:hypothetical protein QJS66_01640 [Kocuria rhizophila]